MSRESQIADRLLIYHETSDLAVKLGPQHKAAIEWYQDGGALADLSYLLGRVAELEGAAEAKRADLVVSLRERHHEGNTVDYRKGYSDGIEVAADLVERECV